MTKISHVFYLESVISIRHKDYLILSTTKLSVKMSFVRNIRVGTGSIIKQRTNVTILKKMSTKKALKINLKMNQKIRSSKRHIQTMPE